MRRLLKRWLSKKKLPQTQETIVQDPEYNLEYVFYLNKRAVSTRY